MIDCGPPDPSAPLAERLAGYLDCHAQSLAHSGFTGLGGGWVGSAFLGGCLTIYVALIGYRLLLGLAFGPRDALIAVARAGLVIALATSWPAYETLVYRVIFDGPAEAAGALLQGDLLVSSPVEAAERLDKDLATVRTASSNDAGATNVAAGAGPSQQPFPSGVQPQPGSPSAQPNAPQTDPILIGAGATLTNLTVGSLGAIRLAGGLLLGLGPLFVVLALFDLALGIVEGWLRGLLTVFVAALGGMVVVSLELGFIESQLTAGLQTTAVTQQMLEPTLSAIATLFSIAMLAVVVAAVVIGSSFRLGRGSKVIRETAPAGASAARAPHPGWLALEPASRSDVVVDAVRRLARRDEAQPALARSSLESHIQPRGEPLRARPADTQTSRETRTHALGRRTTPAQASGLQRRDPPK
jgi:type IV secretion system protein VirB6